ncbi:MAG: flagellar hook-length control protein FliK [Thiogranum sp.]|nr:flagellar hook-length control protein FliK [Thiogranum sp.]
MTASIAALPLSAAGTAPLLVGVGNIPIKQLPAEQFQTFEALLQQTAAALNVPYPDSLSGEAAAKTLVEQLQTLPQGGKLLPLLEQVRDTAGAQGVAPGQVLADLVARFGSAEQSHDSDASGALSVMPLQTVEPNPQYLAVSTSEINSLNRELSRVLQQPGTQDAARGVDPALNERLPQDPKLPGIDKFIAQLQQPAPANPVPPAELKSALAAFRQLATATEASVSGSAGRSDSLAAVTPTQQVTTNLPATGGAPAMVVGTPVGQENWDRALSERVQWLAGQGVQRAQIRLNPAHLGPMEVRIQVQNDQATVHFTSAHAVVREALEAALPRLREMLGSSGVELVNVDVSSGQSFAEQRRTSEQESANASSWNGSGAEPDGGLETVLESPIAPLLRAGLLDLFA